MNILSKKPRAARYILIDDDAMYAKCLKRAFARAGRQLDHVHSIGELGYFARLKNYDVALIDYDLGTHVSGLEISEIAGKFLTDLRIAMISGKDLTKEIRRSHSVLNIAAVLQKDMGLEAIVEAAFKLVSRDQEP